MTHGPVDFIMIGFEDLPRSADIADGVRSLIESGTIRIIDLIFVEKDNAGTLRVREMSDLSEEAYSAWDAVTDDIEGMLTTEDAENLASELPAGNSAVLALYENTWARELSNTIASAGGEVVANLRIPRSVISELEVTL